VKFKPVADYKTCTVIKLNAELGRRFAAPKQGQDIKTVYLQLGYTHLKKHEEKNHAPTEGQTSG
jgi:hypothetical protein